MLASLGAAQRRLLGGGRRREAAPPQLEATPVATGRATVISVGEPLVDDAHAGRWLSGAGEMELEAGLAVLNRALRTFRVVSADPAIVLISRCHALAARVGYGAGEEVAEGRWSEAVSLPAVRVSRAERKRMLDPQARFAATLGGHDDTLVCEELALRARLDLDQGHAREAALQLRVALDAGIVELSADPAYASRCPSESPSCAPWRRTCARPPIRLPLGSSPMTSAARSRARSSASRAPCERGQRPAPPSTSDADPSPSRPAGPRRPMPANSCGSNFGIPGAVSTRIVTAARPLARPSVRRGRPYATDAGVRAPAARGTRRNDDLGTLDDLSAR